LIAHRGDSFDYPENTFLAYDKAIQQGFDNFELDAQLTSDGFVMVVHDFEVDRTSDGSGPVHGYSFEEIRKLDVGGWKADEFRGIQMPTLDEVIGRYKDSARIHLELKSRQQELPLKVAEIIQKHGMDEPTPEYSAPGITVTSFHFDQLYRSLEYLPELPHGWLLRRITERDLELAKLAGLTGIYPNAELATPESVEIAHAAGLSVRCWGIGNSDAALESAYASGASGTTIDWPGRGFQQLQNT
jgi:glycerophosphoryl diester phosphodiesterase